jgi:transketolase
MAAICNGIALHGGVRPACGTFFVFSDYIKPAARLSALMQLPVIFIWTHDAFRVGEDGPTHQPIEQEAQIRLLEELKNHSGKNSLLVLRPSDGFETVVSWKMALENTHTPTALILSRQNINDVPVSGKSRYDDALQAEKGGYIVKLAKQTPDVVLVGNGSEVATLLEGAKLLEERDKLNVQVSAFPSIGLFLNQEIIYREKVLPKGKPVFGLTAGLPSTLGRIVGSNGATHGMTEFGHSAPYKVLDEKLGFTGENVYAKVKAYLKTV